MDFDWRVLVFFHLVLASLALSVGLGERQGHGPRVGTPAVVLSVPADRR